MMLLMEVEGFFWFFVFQFHLLLVFVHFSFQVSHHPPISAGHAENEHFIYDITSKVKTKFFGNSLDVYPLGR